MLNSESHFAIFVSVLMNELLVDTNILVYAIDEDSEFFAKSRFILSKTDCQLCTTSKNFAEFLAVTTRGQNSLSMGDALEVIEDYFSFLPFCLLTTTPLRSSENCSQNTNQRDYSSRL